MTSASVRASYPVVANRICNRCAIHFETTTGGPGSYFCSFECRFWSKVSRRGPLECWPWIASLDSHGYGHIWWNGALVLAHRVAFELEVKPLAEPCVLHECDSPACCNPAHLFPGSKQDNSDDCIRKGRDRKATGDASGSRLYPERYPRGARVNTARLTPEDVAEIRASTEPGPILAGRFGVNRSTITRVRTRASWAHLG